MQSGLPQGRPHILCLSDEFLFALGAGDSDLALLSGNPHRLAAAGAIEMLMFLILQPLPEPQELAIFLIALVGISGQHTEDDPNH